MFMTLSHMPKGVSGSAYFETCKYIAKQLTTYIADAGIRKLNQHGLKGFSVDVESCKEYAENANHILFSTSKPEEQENNRQLFAGVFSELMQLMNLFLEWDWSTYFNPEGRLQRYNCVNPMLVYQILERLAPPYIPYRVLLQRQEAAQTQGPMKPNKKEDKESKRQYDQIMKTMKTMFPFLSSTLIASPKVSRKQMRASMKVQRAAQQGKK